MSERRGSKIGIDTLRNDEGVVSRDTLEVCNKTGAFNSTIGEKEFASKRRGSAVSLSGVTVG